MATKKQPTKKEAKETQLHGNKETSSKYKNLSLRGQTFVGIVVSNKPMKSATVEIRRKVSVPKYERYENRLTRLHVHNPPHIHAKEGDIVKVVETRPLSKTIHHTIVEKITEKVSFIGQKMVEDEERGRIVKKKSDKDEATDKKSKSKDSANEEQ